MNSIVETVSGKMVNVLNPDPDSISIDDIVWHLSRISRFCGATVTEKPYSVLQHCMFVRELLIDSGVTDQDVLFFGLGHDFAEAYIGDIPSPVKHIPSIKVEIDKIEDNILNTIFNKYVGRLPTESEWSIVKCMDKRAQFIEAHTFMFSRGKGWVDRNNFNITLDELQSFPQPKPAIEVYLEFKENYMLDV